MRINISKGGRKIELTKRERQTLTDAKALLSELEAQREASGRADDAAVAIEDVLNGLAGTGTLGGPDGEIINPPY
jgi:hypothetical protein